MIKEDEGMAAWAARSVRQTVYGLIVRFHRGSVCYIGGSDLLPPPLTRDEEEEMMQRMMQSDPKARSGEGVGRGAPLPTSHRARRLCRRARGDFRIATGTPSPALFAPTAPAVSPTLARRKSLPFRPQTCARRSRVRAWAHGARPEKKGDDSRRLPQPVEKGHRKVAFFLIGDSRIEGKNAV